MKLFYRPAWTECDVIKFIVDAVNNMKFNIQSDKSRSCKYYLWCLNYSQGSSAKQTVERFKDNTQHNQVYADMTKIQFGMDASLIPSASNSLVTLLC